MFDFIANNTWLFILLTFLFSLAIGSFLNVIIYRLPIMLDKNWRHACLEYLGESPKRECFNLMIPSSHCPHCHKKIKFIENIPLISYICLGGKCSACQNTIPFRYFLVELLTALLAVVVAYEVSLSMTFFAALIFTYFLVAIAFIDIEHQILPDILCIPLLWLGLLFGCLNIYSNSRDAILGAVIGYGFFWIIGKTFKLITKQDGIGEGDYKLIAAAGAWLGWQMLPFIILTSGLLGLIIGGGFLLIKRLPRSTPIPFGPFIVVAAWIGLLWGFDITQAYLHLFGIYWSNV